MIDLLSTPNSLFFFVFFDFDRILTGRAGEHVDQARYLN
ncbi:hypothetical Protein YC6258_02896 [Gynuella sunshinyii YC6258]|uniref:Uncharacterized protein n=1 Tax=Gynuella sunshinyii YC6258 TaxID=1445510 RepID=A0A0C5VWU7_9GAMM|nr:hypothetical Protein YC6258_02896 [Gynuella sunshinyii YC6258]